MKIVTIVCVVCNQDYSYEYKKGRMRVTCPEHTEKRRNYTRAVKRSSPKTAVPVVDESYPVGYGDHGDGKLSVEEHENLRAESIDAYLRDLTRKMRGKSTATYDVDHDGWEDKVTASDTGAILIKDDPDDSVADIEEKDRVKWVPAFRVSDWPDGYRLDDKTEPDKKPLDGIPPGKSKAVRAWFARQAPGHIPMTAAYTGRTETKAELKHVLGSLGKAPANTVPPPGVWQPGTRPLRPLRAFCWDTSKPFPRYSVKVHSAEHFADEITTQLTKQDWSRWITTDTSTWWD